MSFFEKNSRSILGLSNSDDLSTLRHRNIISTVDCLNMISIAGDTEAPSGVLEASSIAGFSSEISATGVDDQESIAGDSRPNGLAKNAANKNKFTTWTESLGFESSNEKVKGSDLTEESPPPPAGSSSRKTMSRARREKVMSKNFPPLLSTLNKNGRPRFYLSKVRKDGRLQIITVPNHRPEVVRTPRRDGRLSIQLIDADQEEEALYLSEDDRDEEEEDDDGEEREDEGRDTGSDGDECL